MSWNLQCPWLWRVHLLTAMTPYGSCWVAMLQPSSWFSVRDYGGYTSSQQWRLMFLVGSLCWSHHLGSVSLTMAGIPHSNDALCFLLGRYVEAIILVQCPWLWRVHLLTAMTPYFSCWVAMLKPSSWFSVRDYGGYTSSQQWRLMFLVGSLCWSHHLGSVPLTMAGTPPHSNDALFFLLGRYVEAIILVQCPWLWRVHLLTAISPYGSCLVAMLKPSSWFSSRHLSAIVYVPITRAT